MDEEVESIGFSSLETIKIIGLMMKYIKTIYLLGLVRKELNISTTFQ